MAHSASNPGTSGGGAVAQAQLLSLGTNTSAGYGKQPSLRITPIGDMECDHQRLRRLDAITSARLYDAGAPDETKGLPTKGWRP